MTDFFIQQQQQQILFTIGNETNYITCPLQIAYKLIEAGRSEDILQVDFLHYLFLIFDGFYFRAFEIMCPELSKI